MKPHDSPNGARIDAYLDGILAGEERAEFGRELSVNEVLRSAVELQSQVDESLSRLFSIPQVPRGLLAKMQQPAELATVTNRAKRRWRSVAFPVIAATIVWAMLAWHFFGSGTGV